MVRACSSVPGLQTCLYEFIFAPLGFYTSKSEALKKCKFNHGNPLLKMISHHSKEKADILTCSVKGAPSGSRFPPQHQPIPLSLSFCALGCTVFISLFPCIMLLSEKLSTCRFHQLKIYSQYVALHSHLGNFHVSFKPQ